MCYVNSVLVEIQLYRNKIGDVGATAIGEALKFRKDVCQYIWYEYIRSDGYAHMAEIEDILLHEFVYPYITYNPPPPQKKKKSVKAWYLENFEQNHPANMRAQRENLFYPCFHKETKIKKLRSSETSFAMVFRALFLEHLFLA